MAFGVSKSFYPGSEAGIVDEMVGMFWRKALADKTSKTVRSEVNTFLVVCHRYGWRSVPASEVTLMRYVVVLARSLTYASVKKYLGALRHLHERFVAYESYHLQRVLQGIKRVKGGHSYSKLHITPQILRLMFNTLDLAQIEDLAFWCASLLAFLTFFRKSNVCVEKAAAFDEDRHLQGRDIVVGEDIVQVVARWTKTIQFKERVLVIPIVRVKGTIFDLGRFWKVYKGRDKGGEREPAFGFQRGGERVAMTQNWFSQRLKRALGEAGLEAWKYSGHSFRSGGATFAFECGLPMEVIKLQGDWRSDAYLRYVRVEWGMKLRAAEGIAEGLRRGSEAGRC